MDVRERPCELHAIFFNVLKFRVESHHFQVKKTNSFCPKMCLEYGLWPLTSWRFTHTRPRGNQRLFPLGSPSRPATFSLFTKQELRKVAMGLNLTLTCICRLLRPYSKMLTLSMVHPVPRKLSSHPCELHAIFFNVLKFRVESHQLRARYANHLCPFPS
jgi:hypothetical protein